jgi:dTMP kinase
MTGAITRDAGETSGRFIVVDGVDGAGKSTQIELLSRALGERGHRVHVTCEPSGWPVGQLIRRYLRGELTEGVPGWSSMALLFAADRMQHVEHEIEPRLAAGEIVLCDRYDPSSIAYQSAVAPEGADRDALMRWIAVLNDHARRPDLVLLLDLDPETAATRRARRGGEAELYERLDLQRRIRAQYDKLASVRPRDRVVRVDAGRSVEAIHADMLAAALATLS